MVESSSELLEYCFLFPSSFIFHLPSFSNLPDDSFNSIFESCKKDTMPTRFILTLFY
jgi:hypothetical protein